MHNGKAPRQERGVLKRRGLLAGAAALVAAAIASREAQVTQAANGAPVILGGDVGGSGVAQSASGTTWIAGLGTIGANPTFRATQSFPDVPDPQPDGVQGFTIGANNAGVFGRNNTLNGVGTWGETPSGTGAFGDSGSGSGVAGNSGSGTGVFGQSSSGIGVLGQTTSGLYGVFGVSGSAPGGAGLLGFANNPNATAFGTVVTGGATTAGFFGGDVFITGRLVVSNPANKSGLLDHPDGTKRLVYCVESAESWIEDIGTGTLTNGTTTINLDKDFASVVETDDIHVFVTGHGKSHLSVSKKTNKGFTVEADTEIATLKGKKASDLNDSFSWRVVARPKTGKTPERLATFVPPTLTVPKDLPIPTIPKPRPEKQK